MTQDALDKFRKSDGWAAGVDVSVALVKVGANGTVDTTTARVLVEAFVLTNAGLMADVSLAGTKVSPLRSESERVFDKAEPGATRPSIRCGRRT